MPNIAVIIYHYLPLFTIILNITVKLEKKKGNREYKYCEGSDKLWVFRDYVIIWKIKENWKTIRTKIVRYRVKRHKLIAFPYSVTTKYKS